MTQQNIEATLERLEQKFDKRFAKIQYSMSSHNKQIGLLAAQAKPIDLIKLYTTKEVSELAKISTKRVLEEVMEERLIAMRNGKKGYLFKYEDIRNWIENLKDL